MTRIVTLFALLALLPAHALAQVASRTGTLIVAHGGDTEWNARVHAVASEVRTGGPVEVSFLMGPGAPAARFQDAARRLVEKGATGIVVVPVLISSHSGHYEQIRYLAGAIDSLDDVMMHHLHMAGIERAAVKVPVTVTRAIDDAPEIAQVLAERAIAAFSGDRSTRALFIVGHGPNSAEDHAAWMDNLRRVADHVKSVTGFRDVRVGLVRDDAPPPVRAEAVRSVRDIISLQHDATGNPVIVVPALVSPGQVSKVKIPADLKGLPVIYAPDALLPHTGVARWIESRVRGAATAAKAAR